MFGRKEMMGKEREIIPRTSYLAIRVTQHLLPKCPSINCTDKTDITLTRIIYTIVVNPKHIPTTVIWLVQLID